MLFSDKRILLGVTGGIAVYKSPDLVRRLRTAGADVQGVMTAGAQQFVTPLTFQAVSGHPVRTELWDTAAEMAMGHIELARWAAARALAAAPGDELPIVARIKTEHRAGNDPEVERLTLQLAAHARSLEVDLRPETVDVLQQMMEGRVRARLA